MSDTFSPDPAADLDEEAVTDFLTDIDVALGQDYLDAGRTQFVSFKLQTETAATEEAPLATRLADAYRALIGSDRARIRRLVERAQTRCSRAPVGLKRSLVCLDLAHSIDPALSSEAVNADMLLRPADPDDRALWLGQLIRRWSDWNVKVVATPRAWRIVFESITPESIFALLKYFDSQNAEDDAALWSDLLDIANRRVVAHEYELLDAGQDPDIVSDLIQDMRIALDASRVDAPAIDFAPIETAHLVDETRVEVRRARPSDRPLEAAWATTQTDELSNAEHASESV